MTNNNDTDILTPATEPTPERPRRSKAWWIAGGGIGLAVLLGAGALGVSIAEAIDDDRDDIVATSSGETLPDSRDDGQRFDRNDDVRDDRGDDDYRDDDDAPISAEDRDAAVAAALLAVGEGTVTDVDRSDDSDHAWEVEVTFADGRDVDVELDSSFTVVHIDEDN